jgi:hypothetical protein
MLKVRVTMPLSPEDLAQLQVLGCEENPSFATGSDMLFAMSHEHEDTLRVLSCVVSVEPICHQCKRVFGEDDEHNVYWLSLKSDPHTFVVVCPSCRNALWNGEQVDGELR